ncbi:alpha-glucosidase family protein [Oscillatoria sp. CS-180]|uniref:alpha-glucosidase family protein n=1 Tax=Oscillatoria sp. CS-180 TaxID=3021720 RepID=UPI00232FA6F9|nr:alpha-glucosidase family protein [Oscillatoria sp. CS-180]MDB9526557.1 alpha-glucosidase family protein [Oscillatoria sp. CS-180]
MPTPKTWWRSAVIYQIYPRSFADSNNDGIGDLPGILQKLRYVADLGVDAVWISPFFKSPMKDFGYDIADYRAVDPIFGTLDDFKAVLSAAHDYHLKVLIDQVWNHTSNEHPWFLESRESRNNLRSDWYVWADPQPDGSPPNNWLSTFGGSAWTWEPRRQQYYLHNFLTEQPDLNWYNPAVVEAILNTARFWLDLGVDGFRLDVVNFFAHDRQLRDNPLRSGDKPRPAGASPQDPFFNQVNLYNLCRPETLSFLPMIRQLTDSYGATTLAEISSAEDTLAASSEYVNGANRLHTAYNSSLMTDEPLTAQRLNQLIHQVEELFQAGIICWTAGTHDFPRLKSRWSKYQPDNVFLQSAFDRMFIALIITLRGNCCIYQGEELGLTQADVPYEKMQDPFGIQGYPHVLGRDGSRTPMPWISSATQVGFTTAPEPWLPIPEDHRSLSVDLQEADETSLLHHYRQLIRWRKQQPALQDGKLHLLTLSDERLVGFIRECDEQKLLCIFNISPETVYEDLSAFPNRHITGYEVFSDRTYHNKLELPSFGVYFANLNGN